MNNYIRLFICSWLEKISVIRRAWGVKFSICTVYPRYVIMKSTGLCPGFSLSLSWLPYSSFAILNLLSSALSNQTLTNPDSGSIAGISVLELWKRCASFSFPSREPCKKLRARTVLGTAPPMAASFWIQTTVKRTLGLHVVFSYSVFTLCRPSFPRVVPSFLAFACCICAVGRFRGCFIWGPVRVSVIYNGEPGKCSVYFFDFGG